MFWFVMLGVLGVVLLLGWRYDRRHRGQFASRKDGAQQVNALDAINFHRPKK